MLHELKPKGIFKSFLDINHSWFWIVWLNPFLHCDRDSIPNNHSALTHKCLGIGFRASRFAIIFESIKVELYVVVQHFGSASYLSTRLARSGGLIIKRRK